ncbi:MAG: enoyl-CoA hydratase-related protein [Gaiellaceae bacterium]
MSTVRVEDREGVRHVAMARAERRNAFNAQLIAELREALADVGAARAVVLSGDGPSFSAGADADWMRSSVDLTYEENCADAERMRAMLTTLNECPAPTVARVQGHAMGGGAGLVACCDIVLAETDTVFAFSETKLGLIPSVISPFVLAKIGTGTARRYFLTGERFDAETAVSIGLAHEQTNDLDGALDRVLGELASSGPESVRAAKRLIRERPHQRATSELIAEVRATPEAQEGLRAFLEKRAPAWRE